MNKNEYYEMEKKEISSKIDLNNNYDDNFIYNESLKMIKSPEKSIKIMNSQNNGYEKADLLLKNNKNASNEKIDNNEIKKDYLKSLPKLKNFKENSHNPPIQKSGFIKK